MKDYSLGEIDVEGDQMDLSPILRGHKQIAWRKLSGEVRA
jgi:hypothetical protein